jgi:Holliday junction DNA helicase RuvB
VRDYAQVRASGEITQDVAREALLMLDVDEYGLDEMDARIVKSLVEHFDGGPVGLTTLAVAVGEDAGTLEEVYEPFLIQNGFLMRTARGRVATNHAYRSFGYELPVSRLGVGEPQVNLFEG